MNYLTYYERWYWFAQASGIRNRNVYAWGIAARAARKGDA